MKILLSAGNYSSGRDFLSFYSQQIKQRFPQFTIRTVGYVDLEKNLELSWTLDSISSPIFGPRNKEKIEEDIISFAPNLVLNWNEKIISKWAKKHSWELWNCCGAEFLSILKKTEFQIPPSQIPLKIKKSWDSNGKSLPISFWPVILNMNLNKEFCFPILKEQKIYSEKGYIFGNSKIKIELDFLPRTDKNIYLSDGSTSDLYQALLLGMPRIFIFSNSSDPDSICNTWLAEKYNLAQSWKGEYDIDFEDLPEVDYSKLNLENEEKNILNLTQEKYSSSSENGG